MWSAQLDKASREADFSEAVSRLMRVPDGLLPAEMKIVMSQPSMACQHYPLADSLFLEPAIHKVYGQHKFLSYISQPGPHKNKQLTFLDTIWMERMPVKTSQVAMEKIRQKQGRLEPSPLPPCPKFPAFFGESRVYSLRNILQVLHFLGLQMLYLLRKHRQTPASSWEMNVVSDGFLEKSGTPEIMIMVKQLSNISGQLYVLEEQSVSWRQKELFIYSMLVSACLFNMWLGLRR